MKPNSAVVIGGGKTRPFAANSARGIISEARRLPRLAKRLGFLPLLIPFILNCCDEPKTSAGGDQHSSPPGSNGPSPGDGASSDEQAIAASIKKLKRSEEFEQVFADFPAEKGIWSFSKSDQTLALTWFFRAWFAKAPKEALAAISAIPVSDGGLARDVALSEGLSYSPDMPEAYVKAATTLLPDDRATGTLNSIYDEMFKKDPEALFDFLETKLGQGKTKQIAITNLFCQLASKDFRQAVEFARKLTFDEDKRAAYTSIGAAGDPASKEELEWALSMGVPQGEIDRIRGHMRKDEEKPLK